MTADDSRNRDDDHRHALQAIAALADATDAAIMHYREGSPLSRALDRWLVGPHAPGCAHARSGELLLSRLPDNLLMCYRCAQKYWINEEYLSAVSMCDSCDSPMELPGDVHISQLGPFLLIGILCLECTPNRKEETSAEDEE